MPAETGSHQSNRTALPGTGEWMPGNMDLPRGRPVARPAGRPPAYPATLSGLQGIPEERICRAALLRGVRKVIHLVGRGATATPPRQFREAEALRGMCHERTADHDVRTRARARAVRPRAGASAVRPCAGTRAGQRELICRTR